MIKSIIFCIVFCFSISLSQINADEIESDGSDENSSLQSNAVLNQYQIDAIKQHGTFHIFWGTLLFTSSLITETSFIIYGANHEYGDVQRIGLKVNILPLIYSITEIHSGRKLMHFDHPKRKHSFFNAVKNSLLLP
jgi:hypothetical protein